MIVGLSRQAVIKRGSISVRCRRVAQNPAGIGAVLVMGAAQQARARVRVLHGARCVCSSERGANGLNTHCITACHIMRTR